MKITTTNKEDLSPFGNLSWINKEEPDSRRHELPSNVQYDDPWNIEAEYESSAVEASSTGRALLSFQVTSVGDSGPDQRVSL